MSDMPENYFLNGKEMLGFRKEPIVIFPGAPVKRKKKKKGSVGKRSFLILRDGDICHYCKNKMVMPKQLGGPNSMSVEHVVPRALGGSDAVYNLVLACLKCNNDKGSEYIKCLCLFCKEARLIHENPI